MVHFHRGKFHVINPVVLLIDVWRDHRRRLANSRLIYSKLIGSLSLSPDPCGELRIERSQNLRAKREI